MTPTNTPRLLVVTPTLGDSPFLDQTVTSVLTQPAEIEHVIVTPADRVAALQARFPRSQVCADAGKAGGIYGALNVGLAQARSDWQWFTYINDDDALMPGFGAMIADEANREKVADVSYGDVELVDEDGFCISRITVERSPGWIPALLQQGISPLMQQGMLFRRAVVARLRRFDTRYRLCADLDFWLRAYVGRARFRAHRLRVAQFRLRSGQLSGNTVVTEREQTDIVTRLLPEAAGAWKRRAARVRYRCCNLPRYVERWRNRGLCRSYDLLQTEGAPR
jgi:glycosyltransferase involved in cell wall biosynthesis